MKKLWEFIKNFIIFVYILLIIFVTICLLSYNDYKVTVFGKNTLVPIIDEDLEPEYTVGDLLIIEENKITNVAPGDKVFFYRTSRGETTITFAKVRDIEKVTDTEFTFVVEGEDGSDFKFSSSKFIGKTDTVKIIPKVGVVLSVLQSKWGFLFLGVFPSFMAFLYTAHSLILEISDRKAEKEKKKSSKKKNASKNENDVKDKEVEKTKNEEPKVEDRKEETKEEEPKEEKKEDKKEEPKEEDKKEESKEENKEEQKTEEPKAEEKKEEVKEKDNKKDEPKVEDKKEEPKQEEKKEENKSQENTNTKKTMTEEEKKALIEAKMKTMTEEQKKALIEAKLKTMTDEQKRALIEAKKKKMESDKNNK